MISLISFSCDIFVSAYLFFLVQHKLGFAPNDGVRQLVEQSKGEVSPADKATVLKAAVEKRAMALRMKMGKLSVVSNPELTNGWLPEVRTLNIYPFQFVQLILEKRTEQLTRGSVTHIERHYTLNSLSPDLNLQNLQLIATSRASPAFKITLLK